MEMWFSTAKLRSRLQILNTVLLWALSSAGVLAQPGALDTTFSSVPVSGMALKYQPDGYCYAVGYESRYDMSIIDRFDASGSLDPGFVSGPGLQHGGCYGLAVSLASQPGHRVLVASQSIIWDKDKINLYLTRLNANGRMDTQFQAQTITEIFDGRTPIVNRLATWPDGSFVVSGLFSPSASVPRTNLARFFPDGAFDPSFNAGIGANGTIYALAIDTVGNVVIAGSFTQVQGVPRARVARLLPNGQLDDSFDPGPGPDGPVYSVAVQANGRVLIGGAFTTVDDVFSVGIAKLNNDGTCDGDYVMGTGFGGDNVYITSLTVQASGEVIVGGKFTSYGGIACSDYVRIEGDPPPAVSLLRMTQQANRSLQISLQGASDTIYLLQTSTNLVDWKTISELPSAGVPLQIYDRIHDSSGAHFYRTVPKEPPSPASGETLH